MQFDIQSLLCVTSDPCVPQVTKKTARSSEFPHTPVWPTATTQSLCTHGSRQIGPGQFAQNGTWPMHSVFYDIFLKLKRAKVVLKSDATIIMVTMAMTLTIMNVCAECSINHLLFYHGSFVPGDQLHHHRCICLNKAIYWPTNQDKQKTVTIFIMFSQVQTLLFVF